jgi:uncharacterized membrane protein
MKYEAFYANYYDLGIMDQTVYNTFRGRFLELTDPEGINNIKRMAIHNDFFLAFLAPFYFIYQGPETLLVIQSIIIAFGALGLYLISIRLIKNKWLSLLFAFSYLMFVPLQRANLFDFHAVSVVPTFLIFMFYFGATKKYFWSFVFALLAMSTKEQVALTCAMYGIYMAIPYFHKGNDKKQTLFGIAMMILGVLWVAVIYFLIIPTYGKNGSHFAMFRYSHLGSTPAEIIKNVITQPIKTIGYLFDTDSLRYFWFLYGPTLFLSFLTPCIAIIPIFDFAINLLSNDPNMKNIIFQYTSVITPFVFISAIYGFVKIKDKFPKININYLGSLILISVLLFSWVKSPLPWSMEAEVIQFLYPVENIKGINEWVQKLSDENLVISTTAPLAPHFTHHKTIYIFDNRFEKSDYIVIAKSDIVGHRYPYDTNIDVIYLALQKSKLFEKIYAVGDLEVYKKIKPLISE